MVLRKLGRALGFTREERTELSDIVQQTAQVISKDHVRGGTFASPFSYANGTSFTAIRLDTFNVFFKGEGDIICVDDEKLFNSINEGDVVDLRYRLVHTVVYDYLGSDFSEKKLVEKTFNCYQVESAELRN